MIAGFRGLTGKRVYLSRIFLECNVRMYVLWSECYNVTDEHETVRRVNTKNVNKCGFGLEKDLMVVKPI